MLLVQDHTLSKPALDGHLRAHTHLSDPVGFCLQKTMTPQQVKKKRHVFPFTSFYPQPSTLATTYVQLTLYVWDMLWSLSQLTSEMQPSLFRHGIFLKCELMMRGTPTGQSLNSSPGYTGPDLPLPGPHHSPHHQPALSVFALLLNIQNSLWAAEWKWKSLSTNPVLLIY